MKNEEYKKLIDCMMKEINNEKDLKRIFDYIHKIFIRGAGK